MTEAALKEVVHGGPLTKTDKLLLCLAAADRSSQVADIKTIAKHAGIQGVKSWNVSSLLSASKGKAINAANGWELTSAGRRHVEQLAGPLSGPQPPHAATLLRSHLPNITSTQARAFVEEAIACHEYQLHRAAVVLAWVGAVAVLYEHVVNHKLAEFNEAATVRWSAANKKWKAATTSDGLTAMKEHEFLQVLQDIGVLGKDIKEQLQDRLKLRNSCGHPNGLALADHVVASHIELLVLNVFQKF